MKKSLLLIAVSLALFSCGSKKSSETVIKAGAHPEWVYNATIYEVNTRQFTPEGTFNAFAEHLPKLKDLGVDILWFMPIQTIGEIDRKGTLGSYYSIKNYTEVNSEFGTLEDFKNVVKQAHDAGMKVILDWVANHTSRDAVWIEEHPDWHVRDKSGNLNIMYDWTDIAQLDYSKPEMRAAMLDAMLFWVREADIDGFRCDVAYEVPTDFWEMAVDSLKALKSDIFMLAEAEKPELNNKAFDAFYAWEFHHKMNLVAQGKENADSIRSALGRLEQRFSEKAIPMYFTSNHDENSWNGTEFERMGDAAETFAVLTYMLPGMPLIYNGQEVGFNRRLEFFEKDSIDWNDRGNFTNLYKSLNALKKDNPALFSQEKGGEMVEIGNNLTQKVLSFKRVKSDNEVTAVFNLSAEPVKVMLDEEISGTPFSVDGVSAEKTIVKELKLKAWEYRVYYK